MTQIQAITPEFVPLGTNKGSSANAEEEIVGGFGQLFDRLLANKVQADSDTDTTSTSRHEVLSEGLCFSDKAAIADSREELAEDGQESVVRFLAPTLGFAMLCASLQESDSQTADLAGEEEVAVGIPDDSERTMPSTGITQSISSWPDTAEQGVPDVAFALNMNGSSDENVGERFVAQETLSVAEPLASLSSEAELLGRLQAEVPEAFTLLSQHSGEAKGLGNRSQFARYWLLRKADSPERGPDVGQVAGSNEPVELAGGTPSEPNTQLVHDWLAVPTEAAELMSVESAPAAVPGRLGPEELEQTSQLAAYVDISAENHPVPDAVKLPEVHYVARPDVHLAEQLEQGMTLGVRQLRLLRSPEGVTVRMQLYPESLGEVQVELKLVGNTLTAQMRALQPQAAEALRLELPVLRENLVNQGFTQVFLGAETAPQFGQSPSRERQRFHEEHQRRLQRAGIVKAEVAEELEAEPATQRLDYRL